MGAERREKGEGARDREGYNHLNNSLRCRLFGGGLARFERVPTLSLSSFAARARDVAFACEVIRF